MANFEELEEFHDDRGVISPRMSVSLENFRQNKILEANMFKSKKKGVLSTFSVVRRYFLLRDNILTYSDKKGSKVVNTLDMKNCQKITTCKRHNSYFGMQLTFATKDYFLWCTNEDNRDLWVAALSSAQDNNATNTNVETNNTTNNNNNNNNNDNNNNDNNVSTDEANTNSTTSTTTTNDNNTPTPTSSINEESNSKPAATETNISVNSLDSGKKKKSSSRSSKSADKSPTIILSPTSSPLPSQVSSKNSSMFSSTPQRISFNPEGIESSPHSPPPQMDVMSGEMVEEYVSDEEERGGGAAAAAAGGGGGGEKEKKFRKKSLFDILTRDSEGNRRGSFGGGGKKSDKSSKNDKSKNISSLIEPYKNDQLP